jgi:CDP-diacylglycerol--glycerol-3-phosphate 3-phosphatidyltransferase
MSESIETEIEQDSYLEFDNLPNRLTIIRILIIPIVLGCLFITSDKMAISDEIKSWAGWTAGWLFAFAAITDFFDGYIARKRNIVTVFGSFLDPIADKFIVVSSLIMLAGLERIHAFVVIILVLREMYMTSLRLLAMNEGLSVPVINTGKWKTAVQMVGIPFIMANETWQGIPMPFIGKILIYAAAFLAMWSAFQYSFSLLKKLKESRKMKRELKRQEKLEKKNAQLKEKEIPNESKDPSHS